MNRPGFHIATRFLVACIAAGALSSCATYYGVEATLPASVPETAQAMESAIRNISDLSFIPDATPLSDSATLRYIGLQGTVMSNSKGVRTFPKFAVRLQPEGNNATMAVTSVGGDQYAKLVIVATEQELQHRTLVRSDSSVTALTGALPQKSSLLHQILNGLTPAAGMLYVQKNNPYSPPSAMFDAALITLVDAAGLYLVISSASEALGHHQERNKQYKFLVGMVVSTILRYNYGTMGFLQIQQFNALADAPYDLTSGTIDARIAQIGITVKFP